MRFLKEATKHNSAPGLRTVIVKAWIDGTDTGIPFAKFFVSNENYGEKNIVCNSDGIGWIFDVPDTVHYFNVAISAEGYTYSGPPRFDIPSSGEYYAPPFFLELDIPAPPSREDAINITTPFQGFYVDSHRFSPGYKAYYGSQSGQIPFFLFQDFWAVGDGQQVIDQIKAANFKHVMIMHTRGGPGYNQANQPYGRDQLIPPANLSDDQWLEMCDFIIKKNKMLPFFVIMGEGQEGFQNIKDTFQAQVDLLRRGYDRTKYGPCYVCFDGVWPDNWSVAQMKFMIPYMRAILGDEGYLGFMFGNGPAGKPYMWVEDEGDYTKDWMDGLDIVGTTTNPTEGDCPSLANKAGFMIENPNYFASCTKEWNMPFIFKPCSRGPRAYHVIEWRTYQTVRDPNQEQKALTEAGRDRMRMIGYKGWG